MKFKNSVSSIKLKRRTLLIITAGIILLVVLVGSVALYQRHQENVSKAQAATITFEAQADQARTSRENAIKAALADSETKRHQVCDLVAQKAKTKPTAGLIVVPVVACTF